MLIAQLEPVVVLFPQMVSPEPYWITLAGVFGLGAVVGNIVSHMLTSRLQRRVWIQDNKKAEWRELIAGLNESMERMGYAFEYMVVRAASDPLRDWRGAMGAGNRLVRSRIFIAETIERKGIVKAWDELMQYVISSDNPRYREQQGGMPTLNGFNMKAVALQDTIIRVSREDLAIIPTGIWTRLWNRIFRVRRSSTW